MPLKLLAAMALVVAIVCIQATGSQGATEAVNTKVTCDRVASTLGSDSYAGTATYPYATVAKLLGSLRAGQTGCLRAGVYQRDVEVTKGGIAGAPITLTSYPGERAILLGRLVIAETANWVVIEQLDLDGRNDARLPSPTVNGDNITFRGNDVTNLHTGICFLLGSDEWGRARGTVIERNRIHNCGQLPPTNHDHGIYVEVSEGARITDNWIYDNADRGIQLFPNAQRTYVARNVIDGNGQGVLFSRDSSNNVVEQNVISNPAVRYNLETFELEGDGNVARRNCVWSTRHWGNSGIQLDIGVPVVDNVVTEPSFTNRDAKDFRLLPASPCVTLSRTTLTTGSPLPQARKRRGRLVRLRAGSRTLWPGGRLLVRAKAWTSVASPARATAAVLKVRRAGSWRRLATMRLRGTRYAVRLKPEQLIDPIRPRTLRLRAYVRGAGRSNIVKVRVRR